MAQDTQGGDSPPADLPHPDLALFLWDYRREWQHLEPRAISPSCVGTVAGGQIWGEAVLAAWTCHPTSLPDGSGLRVSGFQRPFLPCPSLKGPCLRLGSLFLPSPLWARSARVTQHQVASEHPGRPGRPGGFQEEAASSVTVPVWLPAGDPGIKVTAEGARPLHLSTLGRVASPGSTSNSPAPQLTFLSPFPRRGH